MAPVGLGNNATGYDTSILSNEWSGNGGSPNQGADSSDGSEVKVAAEDQEIKDNATSSTKVTAKGKKPAVKKEDAIPAKRMRSQVDRIADAEIARYDCKRAKFESDQQRIKALADTNTTKVEARSHRLLEVRKAELDLEREKMVLDHQHRMELLKYRQVPPPVPFQGNLQSYPTAWQPPPPFSNPEPLPAPQPFSKSASPQPSVSFQVPSLESFMPPSGHSGSEHCESPSGLEPFEKPDL